MTEYVDVVMTVAPHTEGEFIELEDDQGRSIGSALGIEWLKANDDPYWRLRIPRNAFNPPEEEVPMPDMDKYVTKALDTLEKICEEEHDGEDRTYRENSDRLRAAEAILQHARERSIVINFNGAVPVDPSII